jgi:hypothetical protein
MFLTGQFTATGGGDRGAVRLPGAHIGSNLECTEATLHNKTGPALLADRLQVDQNLLLTARFTATCDGALGAVRLLSAHIGDQLTCTGASSDTGPHWSPTTCRSTRLCSCAASSLVAAPLEPSAWPALTSGANWSAPAPL